MGTFTRKTFTFETTIIITDLLATRMIEKICQTMESNGVRVGTVGLKFHGILFFCIDFFYFIYV